MDTVLVWLVKLCEKVAGWLFALMTVDAKLKYVAETELALAEKFASRGVKPPRTSEAVAGSSAVSRKKRGGRTRGSGIGKKDVSQNA